MTDDAKKTTTVVIEVHSASPEAIERLLANPPAELAGYRVLSIERVVPTAEPDSTEDTK